MFALAAAAASLACLKHSARIASTFLALFCAAASTGDARTPTSKARLPSTPIFHIVVSLKWTSCNTSSLVLLEPATPISIASCKGAFKVRTCSYLLLPLRRLAPLDRRSEAATHHFEHAAGAAEQQTQRRSSGLVRTPWNSDIRPTTAFLVLSFMTSAATVLPFDAPARHSVAALLEPLTFTAA